jgi:hypothetical protein
MAFRARATDLILRPRVTVGYWRSGARVRSENVTTAVR